VTKDPKGICALAGGAVAVPNAKSKITPSRLIDFLLTLSPTPDRGSVETALPFILKRKPCCASKTARQTQICFIRSVARINCSRIPGSIAEWPASGTIT
jgi:hypothetical protein